ncbi:hypothetical protein [Oceanirhabdus sp. W0125-5]|uniref:hypothetical protein n=1 Tax=Oceanirhabdus sp. W0125-5 TaxID=2999116 RepID=UPI0022F343EF|nr:hypothetical protein [Oceanirhabdus sp. W0125-5]WBW94953.1 hypothetical protein OW730_14750 [Oceanirhabdus sp. W0125-5]
MNFIRKITTKHFFIIAICLLVLLSFFKLYSYSAKYKAKLGTVYIKQLELIKFHSYFLEENILNNNLSKEQWNKDFNSIQNYTMTLFWNEDTTFVSDLFQWNNFFNKYGNYEEIISDENKQKELISELKHINKYLERIITEAYDYQKSELRYSFFYKEYKNRFFYDYLNKTSIEDYTE